MIVSRLQVIKTQLGDFMTTEPTAAQDRENGSIPLLSHPGDFTARQIKSNVKLAKSQHGWTSQRGGHLERRSQSSWVCTSSRPHYYYSS